MLLQWFLFINTYFSSFFVVPFQKIVRCVACPTPVLMSLEVGFYDDHKMYVTL